MVRLFHILFAAGCIGSMFVYSHQFTDAYIVPKWCWVLFVILGMLVCATILALQRKPVLDDIAIWGSIIVFSCWLQAIYGILQYVGLFPSNATFRVTGSFENPAGFAACLCAGLPFVAYLLSNRCKYIRYAGLALLWGIVGVLVYCYKQNSTQEKKIALYALLSIGIFSLFSYPFTYPFTWMVTFLAVLMLTADYLKRIKIGTWGRNIMYTIAIMCFFWGRFGWANVRSQNAVGKRLL